MIKIRYIVKGYTGAYAEDRIVWNVAVHDTAERALEHAAAAQAAMDEAVKKASARAQRYLNSEELHNRYDLAAWHIDHVIYEVEPVVDFSCAVHMPSLSMYQASVALYQAKCELAKLQGRIEPDEPVLPPAALAAWRLEVGRQKGRTEPVESAMAEALKQLLPARLEPN